MNNFFLFRIKSQQPKQHGDFFIDEVKPAVLIRSAIKEYTNKEIKQEPIWKNQIWRIGDVENLINEGLFFTFGRELKSDRDFFDAQNIGFRTVNEIIAPYAYVFISFKFQVCAIALRKGVNLKPKTLARKLEKILSNTNACKERKAYIIIPAIDDPDEFISLIEKAEFITKFQITFDLPNPFDINETQKGVEKFAEATKADKGRANVSGKRLDKVELKKISQSVASTGNKAKAKVKLPGESHSRTIHMSYLSKNQSLMEAGEFETVEEKNGLLKRIENFYSKIRGDAE